MKKKIISLCLVVAMLATAIVGASMAYLQDEDSDVNVMTLGNVDIELIEQQRSNGADSELEPFEDDKPLYPIVGSAQGEKDKWGLPIAANYVDKIVSVKNTGVSEAYIRVLVAVPAALENDDASKNALHWNYGNRFDVNGEGAYNTGSDYQPDYNYVVNTENQVEMDGITYNVYSFTYNTALAAGETFDATIIGFYLDENLDNEDGKYVLNGNVIDYDISKGVQIPVMAQAIQTAGFATAAEAFKASNMTLNPWDGSAADTWDGTADTAWYNDTDTAFVLTTAEQLAGLADLVDSGNSFAGKTITLSGNVDLYAVDENGDRVSFNPIGDDVAFEGTFDGAGHTIENLYQSGWDFGYEWGSYGSVGLFGELKNATVKNLTISGAESLVEGGDIGGITGSASGTCVFENITIEDSTFATYNNGNGGIIGWSGAGEYTFKNITIAEDTVLAGLWGSFDSSIGGIVGQGEPGATYNFENVDIACRLDVYNDCTASYDYYNYRMCGMIIGRLEKTTTIDGANYPDMSQYNITCTNVTVTYGEWANYHYCDPTPGYNNGRGMRVEPGYSYDGLPEDYDHTQCTTHHNELIAFDQIFGGAQLNVKGLKAYDGVTVTYNNK